ncbi:hypothetical protein, partial [Longimycelium tulufanense]|uniref:hypothetical protein n=1 Tax=Longimycelium tulufanense TaxID=907463 RepID=UPI00166D822A
MARIRTVKPEFWSSPATEGMSPWARLLFIAMWNWADDHGRGSANPGELAGFAFPNDDLSSADIRRMLGEIRRGFGVKFYKVGGRPFYAIPTWAKHQKIDKRSGAKYPTPEDGDEWDPDPEHTADQHEQQASTESAEPPPSLRQGFGGNRLDTGRSSTEGPGELSRVNGNSVSGHQLANHRPPDIDRQLDTDLGVDLPERGASAGSAESPLNPRRSSVAGTGEQGNRGRGLRNGGTSPAHAREERPRLNEISGTAHSPAAHRLVTAYAKSCRKRPPTSVLQKLGPLVDQLLRDGYTEDQIGQALKVWGRKGIGTHLLP